MNELDRIALNHIEPTLKTLLDFCFNALLEAGATHDSELRCRIQQMLEKTDPKWQALQILAKRRDGGVPF